jgi:hypothetical protein
MKDPWRSGSPQFSQRFAGGVVVAVVRVAAGTGIGGACCMAVVRVAAGTGIGGACCMPVQTLWFFLLTENAERGPLPIMNPWHSGQMHLAQ